MEASAVPLPPGVKASDFSFNPYDLPIIIRDGTIQLAAFEFNDSGYAGIESAPPEIQRLWLAHFHKIGVEIRADHLAQEVKTGVKKPLVVIVGSSGRETEPKKNNKTIVEKVLIGDKIAEAIGGKCMSHEESNKYFNTQNRKPGEDYWPPKEPLVIVGYSKEINEAIEVRNGRAFLNGVEIDLVVNGRTAANIQASHSDLDPKTFRHTNITNQVGTDKGAFMELMYSFNTEGPGKDLGTAYGLETPLPFKRITRNPDETHGQAIEKLNAAVVDMLDMESKAGRGDVVVKASGGGNGIGVFNVPSGSKPDDVSRLVEKGATEVKDTYGTGAGFPWAMMPRVFPVVINGNEQELRMVSFAHDGKMHCIPVIFKKSPVPTDNSNGELQKNNVTANDAKLTAADKEDPRYLTNLVDPACNWEVLAEYGLKDQKELLNTAKYLSHLSVYALERAKAQEIAH